MLKKPSENLPWPDSVLVLDETHDTSGKAGCDLENYPRCIFMWMQFELREQNASVSQTSLMIDIWMREFHRIYPVYHRMKSNKGYQSYDLYNSVWALLGYVENQSQNALTLVRLCQQLRR